MITVIIKYKGKRAREFANEMISSGLGHRMGILGCSTAEMKMSLGC